MKLLIAYDGSERSDAALADLRRAGLGDRVQADLLGVAEVWIPPENLYAGPSLVEMALRDIAEKGQAELERVTRGVEAAGRRLRDLFPAWNVSTHVKIGPAALQILEFAEGAASDLIVAGAQGHVVIAERLGLGSVALKVLTHSPVPVRIARPSHAKRPDHLRIMVATDGSPDAASAVDAVIARRWPAGTEARVVTAVFHRVLALPQAARVIPPGPYTIPSAEKIAHEAARKLLEAGLKMSVHVVSGEPKQTLVDCAREWDADCMFLGARGLTGVERFVLGSVSTSVAMHASCSVEVIHPKNSAEL
jgi:nucleotide-binding universal stress UspA family protein